jgi:glycine betaine/choline ABC-type transport system substrate-binding protein
MGRTQIAACLIACLAAIGCSRSRAIVVGSKNFTEQVLLGEIIAQQLERRLDIPIERRLNLGGTLLAHQALMTGDIDLYPEYTGTALTNILKMPPSADRARVLETVRSEYRRRWGEEWIAPLGFNNSFAMIIRGEDARRNKYQTLSEAARRKDGWRLGAGYEFLQRADGLPGLLKTYGLPMRDAPKTMDLGLLYTALLQRQVDMVAASATDGPISALDVAILSDDKAYFPPYECAVVVRQSALGANPRLRPALEELQGKLPDAVMRKLNFEVDGKHRSVVDVSREFLGGLR